jgi:hypothetical protein
MILSSISKIHLTQISFTIYIVFSYTLLSNPVTQLYINTTHVANIFGNTYVFQLYVVIFRVVLTLGINSRYVRKFARLVRLWASNGAKRLYVLAVITPRIRSEADVDRTSEVPPKCTIRLLPRSHKLLESSMHSAMSAFRPFRAHHWEELELRFELELQAGRMSA